MSTTRLALLLAAALFATAVATADAKPPPVVQHTYLVQYTLSGSYSANTIYPDTNAGFCPGTGYVEDADFSMTAAGKLKVKLETGSAATANVLPSPNVGTWTQQGTAISAGDPCTAIKQEHCDGALTIGRNSTGANTLSAHGVRRQIVFSTDFSGLPHEQSQPADCDQTSDIYPVMGFTLAEAVQPYEQAKFGVSLTKLARLAKGRKLTGRATPVRYPSGYSVATCNDSAPCIGSFAHLASTIAVTRTK